MASSLDVARYLIHLASPSEDEDIDCLCPLRLQKLLYYVQGWHLAACGHPLFAGRIEAWKYGPVVREVYTTFRDYGYRTLPPLEGTDPATLSPRQKGFIRSVWEQYRRYSASALREMTHQEAPWLEARGHLGPDDKSNAEISHHSLQAFFQPKLDEQVLKSDPRIDPAMWVKSRAAMETGRVQTVQEVRRELRRRRAGADAG